MQNSTLDSSLPGLGDPTGISLFQTPVDTTSFIYKYETIPDNERTMVTIMAILEYNKIVIRKPNEKLEKRLLKFSKEIQSLVESQPQIKNIKLGMPCICHYSGDGLWYRAQIYNIDGLDCDYAIVFFVDFGNIEPVTVDKIRMMKPDWFNYPASCHIASLNFELKTSNHKEYVTQHIQKLFGINKICEVVSKNPLTVNLYDQNEELNYQSLVKSGLIVVT